MAPSTLLMTSISLLSGSIMKQILKKMVICLEIVNVFMLIRYSSKIFKKYSRNSKQLGKKVFIMEKYYLDFNSVKWKKDFRLENKLSFWFYIKHIIVFSHENVLQSFFMIMNQKNLYDFFMFKSL